ncbi:MAG: ABC transporter ATP-binding protein [Chitinophagaceae bacterium]|nr:ABC transporter ATP-binding protein [Chitinophagaceae bacterium]MCW5906101.1 ABC transporter ATP-binding protein [Chitinophagaceae bacterium]
MQIQLNSIGKRFNREWIFKNLSYTFYANNVYAITGANGSGKSTLLQVIAGSMNISEGTILYQNNQHYTAENIYTQIAIVAPYIDLIEEMTATEFLQFHHAFKQLVLPIQEIIQIVGLEKAAQKQMRYYSSGMKQRVKLAQAVFTQTPIILLDEPCTNLDKAGFQLYYELIKKYCSEKLVIVCSNDENEINFCTERLNIMNWK